MEYTIWESMKEGIIDYAMGAYSTLEPWTYPIIFIGIVGFIYASMQSIIVAVVSIIIIFTLYGTQVFVGVPEINQFFYIIAVLGIAMLITTLFIKRRS